MKNSKSNNVFYIVVCFVIALSTLLLSVAHEPVKISEMENRRLTAIPHFSLKSVLKGDYQEQMEDGLKDQSLIKNSAVRIATALDMLTAKQDRNGTYMRYDGTYVKMENDDDYKASRVSLNTRIIGRLAEETGKHIDICLIPPKGSAEPDRLPPYAPYINDGKIRDIVWKNSQDNKLVWLVPFKDFFDAEDGKYFYTDHHYNSLGAYYAVKDYQNYLGRSIQDISFFSPSTVGDNFYGTLYRKAPMYNAKVDRMTLPSHLPDMTITYRYATDGRLSTGHSTTTSLYEPEYLFTSDKYSVYMGGNHGLCDIVNNSRNYGAKLLIIKDSFANSAIPYLIGSYKEIVMIDLRYYGGYSLMQEIKKQNPDRIVIWYETLDYATESRFAQLLR